MIGGLIHMITGIPHVTSIHGTDIHLVYANKVFYPLMKIIAHYSDYLTANSRHTHRLLKDIISNMQNKTALIPMGIHPEQFTGELPVKTGTEKTILFVGRLIQLKGVSHLINAMHTIVSRGHKVRLLIIGNGPDKNILEHLTHELGISSNVHFLGYIRHSAAICSDFGFIYGKPINSSISILHRKIGPNN